MEAGIEELDAPVAELTRVRARVSRPGRGRPLPVRAAEDGPNDRTSAIVTGDPAVIPSMASMNRVDPAIRASWVVTAVVVSILVLVIGDDGPWIVVIPSLTAVGLAWLDRRIQFSFAEGFIGYCADPGPAHGDLMERSPAPRERSAPAAA